MCPAGGGLHARRRLQQLPGRPHISSKRLRQLRAGANTCANVVMKHTTSLYLSPSNDEAGEVNVAG